MSQLIRLSLVVSALWFSIGISARASAQCSSQCNPTAEHWTLPGFQNRTRVGMVEAGSGWAPAYCYLDAAGDWVFGGTIGNVRAARVLVADSSICGSSIGNWIERKRSTDTLLCAPSRPPTAGIGGSSFSSLGAGGGPPPPMAKTLYGFSNNGFEFRISGGEGNDKITSDEPATICGGNGNDILVGGQGYQYIAGGSGNDWIDGRYDYDNIRGGSGNDVLRDTFIEEPDKVRGEGDQDCLMLTNAPYVPDTSCGAQTDGFFTIDDSLPLPPGCESRVDFSWCCEAGGRICAFDVAP